MQKADHDQERKVTEASGRRCRIRQEMAGALTCKVRKAILAAQEDVSKGQPDFH